MSPILSTRDKTVQKIVEYRQRMVEQDKVQRDAIRENWKTLRKKGFGYSGDSRGLVVLDYEQGRYLFDVMPDGSWKDQRCFIIGGGESLKDFDFSTLRGEFVIGINRAYEVMDCTINFAMDHNLYEWITEGRLGNEAKEKFENFKGFPVWLDSAGYNYPKGIFILNKSGSQNISRSMKKGLGGESNSGFGALNLAVCLGANPIYLLGFDMCGKNGKQVWWHSGYPDKQRDDVYKVFANDFKRTVSELKERNIQVINLNPESKLKCFDFGKFEDIKTIKRPIITSYYTEGTEYESQVKQLKITLRRFNLENDVVGIPDQGSWHKNTYYKSKFILQMMKKYPKRAIIFVDADAKIRRNPVLFNNFDCDFACHFYHEKELLSGTLYFGNTKGARYLINKWIEEDKLYPKTHMPQKNLRTVFEKHKNEINWKALPVEYCMIFDSNIRRRINPVIEHFQLSRKYKVRTDNRHSYMMKRPLNEIQEFCRDKTNCLLGNADSILRRKKDIDSFDIIGRMNRGMSKGKEGFIGKRTDILFLSTHMSGENIKNSFDPNFVVWMTACNRLASSWVMKNAIQNPKEDWNALHAKLGINPTTGIMALKFILKHIDFKNLVIYGFDFFTTKTWYNTKIDSGQKHSGEKEEVLFMEMIKNNPKVKFVS